MNDESYDIINELENMTEANKNDVLRRASLTDLEMYLSFFNKHTMNPVTKEWVEEVLHTKQHNRDRLNTLFVQTSNIVFGIIIMVVAMILSDKFLK